MQVTVRYHALLRERLGCAEEPYALPDGSRVGAVVEAFAARHEGLAPLAGRLAVAVNDEFAQVNDALTEGDTVDLLPPFGGG